MKKLFAILLFISFCGTAFPQSEWKLEKESNGVQIFLRKVEGSSFHEFRGVTKIKADLNTLVKVIQDGNGFKEWMPNTSESKLVEQPDDLTHINYIITDAPWPVKDREGFYKNQLKLEEGMATFSVNLIPGSSEKKKGIVKMLKTEGFWQFKELDGGWIEATYQLHSEPGGGIPAWLAKSSVIKIPYETLLGLKERKDLEKYSK